MDNMYCYFIRYFIIILYYYSVQAGERSIVSSLSVCLSASMSLEPLDRPPRNCLRRSPVAVARSSSGGVTICYILPDLRTTSRLAVMDRTAIAAL